jgi:hypothetical protein
MALTLSSVAGHIVRATALGLLDEKRSKNGLRPTVGVDPGEGDPRRARNLRWPRAARPRGRRRFWARQLLPLRTQSLLPEDRHLGRGQSLLVTLALSDVYGHQDGSESLVFDDLAGADMRILVDGQVGQGGAFVTELDPAVLPLAAMAWPCAWYYGRRAGRRAAG